VDQLIKPELPRIIASILLAGVPGGMNAKYLP
jgi:hypothetical protein